MKAIFWKEIRENLKWGALGFITFVLALGRAWSQGLDPNRGGGYEAVLSSAVLTTTTFCPALLAAALGFLQIVPEQRRDRWAFLVHRPVAWATIFWGKVTAGLALYFLALLLPWAFLCWWASIPGHSGGPFNWGMGLAGLSDIFSGITFYFAGMIVSLRQARWFGSKALALMAALWVLYTAQDAVHFWGAQGWTVLVAALLLISARENFLRNGVYPVQGSIARLALAVLFVLGLFPVVGWVFDFARNMSYSSEGIGSGSNYRISGEGEVVRMYITDGVNTKAVDGDGNDLKLSKEQLLNFGSGETDVHSLEGDSPEDGVLPFRDVRSYFMTVNEYPFGTYWFYNRAPGRLEAYERYTRNLKGYLAPDGWRGKKEGPSSSAFPAESVRFTRPPDLMVFNSSCYLVDYNELTARLIKQTDNAEDFKGAALLVSDDRQGTLGTLIGDPLVAVGLKEGVAFYKGSDASLLCQVPYEQDIKAFTSVRAGKTRDGRHLIVWYFGDSDLRAASGYTMPIYLYRYSMSGTLEKKSELPSIMQPRPGPPWTEQLWSVRTSLGQQIYYFGKTWVGKSRGNAWSIRSWHDQYSGKWPPAQKLMWLVSALTGLACALVAMVAAKSSQLSGRELAGWFLFIFFGGIAGLLVFFAINEWPVRVACKACGEPRMVGRETCEHCDAAWEKPAPDGTEIFIPVSRA